MNWKWLKTVEQVAPMVLLLTPAAPIAPFAAMAIKAAEEMTGASGQEKLDKSIYIVRQGIAATNAQVGREVINPGVADQAIASGISLVVDVANLVNPK